MIYNRSQVVWLLDVTKNIRLSDSLTRASEAGDAAAHENAWLNGVVSFLHIQLDTTYSSLGDLEDVSCDNTRAVAANLKTDSSE